MQKIQYLLVAAGLAMAACVGAAYAEGQTERDACVAQLHRVGGPDARNRIDVLSTEWSQAGTLVMMRDAGGTIWRCIGYRDGSVGELTAVDPADDGQGAMGQGATGEGATSKQGPENEGTTTTETVHFSKGTSGAVYDSSLSPGSTKRYVLGAKKGQFLTVQVTAEGPMIGYQIWNPDGTVLLDLVGAGKDYRGQLWQSGDHVVEILNRGNAPASYRVVMGIE